MSNECGGWHPESGEVLEPSEVRKAFGPTAGKSIPAYPDYSRLQRYPDRGAASDPVYLSRLACGHFLVSSPTLVKAAEVRSEERTPLEFARMTYQLLLERAHDGEDVDPADVARAQAAIMLEERAAAGRRERQEAARAKAEQEHRASLEGPAQEQLTESQANLQAARDEAFQAIMALLDAVDEDDAAHDQVLATLTGAGFPLDEVRPPANGYLQRTRVGGQDFPYWPKAEHLIGVLQAVHYSRQRGAFISLNGRDLMRVPAPIADGPRVSAEAQEAAAHLT